MGGRASTSSSAASPARRPAPQASTPRARPEPAACPAHATRVPSRASGARRSGAMWSGLGARFDRPLPPPAPILRSIRPRSDSSGPRERARGLCRGAPNPSRPKPASGTISTLIHRSAGRTRSVRTKRSIINLTMAGADPTMPLWCGSPTAPRTPPGRLPSPPPPSRRAGPSPSTPGVPTPPL